MQKQKEEMAALALTEGILLSVSFEGSGILKKNCWIVYKISKNLLKYLTWFQVQYWNDKLQEHTEYSYRRQIIP